MNYTDIYLTSELEGIKKHDHVLNCRLIEFQ